MFFSSSVHPQLLVLHLPELPAPPVTPAVKNISLSIWLKKMRYCAGIKEME